MDDPGRGQELPLTTVESLVAAMIEAGPEAAEHMVRAANELLLAAQAITAAAERRLAEQRRRRDEAATSSPTGASAPASAGSDAEPAPGLRPVDEVA